MTLPRWFAVGFLAAVIACAVAAAVSWRAPQGDIRPAYTTPPVPRSLP